MRQQTAGRIAFLVSLALFFVASNLWAEWYVYHRMGFDSSFRFESGAHVKSDVLDLYVDFKYYRELCRYLEENEIPAVIFLSPVNHALLQRYQLLDYDAYEKNTGIIARAALQRDIAFFNYQDAIPQELFHDSLHMLDGGNAAMAELLSRDLRPYLQGVHAR
ncbi:hypothetical protein [Pelotomaculum sp. PtaB.Bin117]|uniref:hypothetical protein n=2 Tax=Pelotomaculum TaxID=191373 RepID=UPI0009D27582|nr:hypothetical protein [Pelotomaculum sp. PtaB.Bin117]OPX89331.1 MAG: hypothetical protein A4E54_01011 [Pelotomaculum sp. PtaB.Bin117]